MGGLEKMGTRREFFTHRICEDNFEAFLLDAFLATWYSARNFSEAYLASKQGNRLEFLTKRMIRNPVLNVGSDKQEILNSWKMGPPVGYSAEGKLLLRAV